MCLLALGFLTELDLFGHSYVRPNKDSPKVHTPSPRMHPPSFPFIPHIHNESRTIYQLIQLQMYFSHQLKQQYEIYSYILSCTWNISWTEYAFNHCSPSFPEIPRKQSVAYYWRSVGTSVCSSSHLGIPLSKSRVNLCWGFWHGPLFMLLRLIAVLILTVIHSHLQLRKSRKDMILKR